MNTLGHFLCNVNTESTRSSSYLSSVVHTVMLIFKRFYVLLTTTVPKYSGGSRISNRGGQPFEVYRHFVASK